MSIPSGVLKYAGIWSVSSSYLYADFVVSPIDSLAYVLVITTLTGGADPSVPSASWVNIPNGGGGGGITSLNGLDSGDNAGILTLVSADGSVTFTTPTPSTGQIDASVTYPTTVTQLNGLTSSVSLTSPLNTITITPTGPDIELEANIPPLPIPSYASFYSNTTQALNNGLETILTYDGKSIGTGDLLPVGGVYPTSGVVVMNAGVYKVLFSIQVDRNALLSGDFQAYIKAGGVAVPETNTVVVVNQSIQTLNTCEFIVSLIAGTTIQVGCWSNSVGQQALAVPISGTTPVAIPSIILNIYRLE